MRKAEAALLSVCLVAPGGLILLGALAIMSPKFRSRAVELKNQMVDSVKKHID